MIERDGSLLDQARQYQEEADRLEHAGCPHIISPLVWMARIEDLRSRASKLEQDADLLVA